MLALATFAIGAIILVGWCIDSDVMKSLVPGLVPVKANTALGLMLAATALWLRINRTITPPAPELVPGRRSFTARLSMGCSGIVIAIAVLTLAEYVFGIDCGIDQMLFREAPGAAATIHLGRMAIPTALVFLLVGNALLITPRGRGLTATRALTGSAVLIACMAFIGQLYDMSWLAAYGHYTPMGVVTSFAFILLCTGMLISSPAPSGTMTGQAERTMWMTVTLVTLYLAILGGSIVTSIRRSIQFQAAISRSIECMHALMDVHATVKNAEIAARGYLLTQDPAFLGPELTGPSNVVSSLHQLLASPDVREELRPDLDEITSLIKQKAAFLDATVAMGQAGHFDRAIDAIREYEGKTRMEQIDRLVEKIHQDEMAYLPEASATSRRTIAALCLGGVVVMLFLVLIFLQLTREISDHQKALSERNRMFNLSPDLLCTASFTGHFRELNPSFQKLLGWSERELKERPFIELVVPDDRNRSLEALESLVEGKPVMNFDNRLQSKDGTVRWISWNTYPSREVGTIYAIGRDMTERIQNKEELQLANQRLQDALTELRHAQAEMIKQERMNALSLMVSGIAHDFNNTLMPIVGLPELLIAHPERLDDKEEVLDALGEIRTAALDARDIVRRLREFYRPDDLITVASLDLPALVTQVIALTEPAWRVQPESEGRHITVQTEFTQVKHIKGNASSLREMLTNLIINAAHAISGSGTITIRVSGDETWTSLQVADTGVGMSPEVQARCFEPFFSTKGPRGTGLGLSVCYGIVKRHDGTMTVESQQGVGTTFTVRLPTNGPARSELDHGDGPTPSRMQTPRHILVVDDSEQARTLIDTYLRSDGHTVDLAHSGDDGLLRLKQGDIDLILTDRAMPTMHGDRFAMEARRIAPHVPIIMLTGFGDMMNYRSERPEGVDVVLAKPVTPSELSSAIAAVMNAKCPGQST